MTSNTSHLSQDGIFGDTPVMLIDWTTAAVQFLEDMGFGTGEYMAISPSGEVLRTGPQGFQVEHPSWSESVRLYAPNSSVLVFSGNPVKWFQGHNAFGSADAPGLVWDCLQDIRMQHLAADVGVPGFHTTEAHGPGVRFTRIDVTRSARHPGGDEGARAWLRAIGREAGSSHRGGVAVGDEGTVYFGKRSKRWGLKVYLKADEMKKHPPKLKKLSRADMRRWEQWAMARAWAEGVLRFELVLRSTELGDAGVSIPRTVPEALALWGRYYRRLSIREGPVMAQEIEGLKPSERAALKLWEAGESPKGIYPRASFYRHRRAILKKGGPDIASPGPAGDEVLQQAGGELEWDPEVPEGASHEPSGQRPLAFS